MHRLVRDDLFEQRRRRIPGQPRTPQKADVEPGRQQMAEVGVQRLQVRILTVERQQIGAHVDQKPRALGQRVELGQAHPRADQGAAQGPLGRELVRFAAGLLIARDRPIGCRPLDPELGRQDLEKTGASGLAEAEIDRRDARRLSARQHLAAARLEACAHLGAQLGLIRPEIGVITAREGQPRARGDVADHLVHRLNARRPASTRRRRAPSDPVAGPVARSGLRPNLGPVSRSTPYDSRAS